MKSFYTLATFAFLLVTLTAQGFCQEGASTMQGRELELMGTNAETMLMIRRVGLERDRSQVERLLEITREDKVSDHVLTACWALGRIGDPRALSVFDNITFWKRGRNVRRLLALDKARLLYEQEAHGEKSTSAAEARTRLDVFLHALNLTLPQLKQRFVYAVGQDAGPNISERPSQFDIYLVREIADIIFAYGDESLKRIIEDNGIKFSKDTLSEWKVRLSLLPASERQELLMTELSTAEQESSKSVVSMQLLVDLGEPAQQAIAQKLRDIRQHRSDYDTEVIRNFLLVYVYFRNNRNREIVQAFKEDADKEVASRATYVDGIIAENKVLFEFMDTRY